jgi:hypothetical protein
MNTIRHTPDIVSYENFLTTQECKTIIDILNEAVKRNTIEWMPISFYESYSSVLIKDNDPLLEEFGLSSTYFSDLEIKMRNCVAEVHGLNPDTVVKIGFHTQKWEPGAYARIHSDNTDEQGHTGPFARSKYAAFVYLNDDFEGGQLHFPKQELTITPKVGLCAAFDGGFNNMHEVTLITKGIRWTLGSFWDDREEDAYPQEVRDAWAEEMKKIREAQVIEKAEWQELLKEGYKLDKQGNKYRYK